MRLTQFYGLKIPFGFKIPFVPDGRLVKWNYVWTGASTLASQPRVLSPRCQLLDLPSVPFELLPGISRARHATKIHKFDIILGGG